MLCKYQWPGNIRQLQNLVERLVIMSGGGAIGVKSLPDEYTQTPSNQSFNENPELTPFEANVVESPVSKPGPLETVSSISDELCHLPEEGIDLGKHIECIENTLILEALARTKNNKNQAAKLLGLNRTTLVERIKKRKIFSLQSPSKEL